jgi:hypothetical protein
LKRQEEDLRRVHLGNDAKEVDIEEKRLANEEKRLAHDEKRLAMETTRIENERIQFFLQRAKEGDLAAAKELERSQR